MKTALVVGLMFLAVLPAGAATLGVTTSCLRRTMDRQNRVCAPLRQDLEGSTVHLGLIPSR